MAYRDRYWRITLTVRGYTAKMIRSLLVIVLLESLPWSAMADGITVSQSLDKSSVAFEDSVTFQIRLEWEGPQVAYLFPRPLDPGLEGLKVRGFSSSIGSSGSGPEEHTTKTFRFTLIPTSPGIGRIEPISISYVNWPDSTENELITEAMTVSIASPVAPEQSERPGWLWFGLVIVVLAGAATGVVFRWRAKRAAREPEQRPEEVFLERLGEVKKKAGGDMKVFQTELYGILSDFLRSRFGIEPEGLSPGDLSEALTESGLDERSRERIAAWFSRAKEDKFRPVASSPGETVRLESEIRDIFEKF